MGDDPFMGKENHSDPTCDQAELFGALFDLAPDAILVVDDNSNYIAVNDAACGMVGFSREELLSMTVFDLTASNIKDQASAIWRSFLDNGQMDGDYTLRRKDGKIVYLEFHAVANVIPGFHVAYMKDITARRETWIALQKAQSRLNSVFEAAPVGIGFSKDRVIHWANNHFSKLVGYSPEAIQGMHARKLYPTQDDFDNIGEMVKDLNEENNLGRVTRQSRLISSQGNILDVWISAAFNNPENPEDGLAFAVLDITEHLRALRELQTSEKRFEEILDTLPQFVAFFDHQFNLTMLNRTFSLALGRKVNEPRNIESDEIRNHGWYSALQPYLAQATTGQLVRCYEVMELMPGVKTHIDGILMPDTDSEGNVRGVFAVLTDISVYKEAEQANAQLEAQLQQAQKMEAIGQLAGGIAHDFNNLLTGILGYMELISIQLGPDHEIADEVSQVLNAAERASDLTKQLLAFSRKQVVQQKIIDLNEIIAGTQNIIGRLIGEDIQLEFLPGESLWNILADTGHMDQILINLATNARDAMPAGGRLEIRTENVVLAPTEKSGPVGPFVKITVGDTGTGIAKEVVDRIFEPFFSTKDKDKGTGLGLSTVYGLVKQHKGRIEVESQPGNGTKFHIYFPKARAFKEMKNVSKFPDLQTSEKVILLVEDEPVVRQLARKMLEKSGYQVLEAGSGPEAINLCHHHGLKVDLLLTDIIMPNMNGKQLYERLHSENPDLQVLFMSGYTSDIIAQHDIVEGGSNFIGKPFQHKELTDKIRQIFDR